MRFPRCCWGLEKGRRKASPLPPGWRRRRLAIRRVADEAASALALLETRASIMPTATTMPVRFGTTTLLPKLLLLLDCPRCRRRLRCLDDVGCDEAVGGGSGCGPMMPGCGDGERIQQPTARPPGCRGEWGMSCE